jgi:hypothetical protein
LFARFVEVIALFLVVASISITAAQGGTSREERLLARRAAEVVPPNRAAPWRGSGVVHARFLSPAGTVATEEWLDRATDATRLVERDRFAGGTVDHVKVTRGRGTQSWNSLSPHQVYEYRAGPDVDDPWRFTSSDLLYPWRMLSAGRAQIVGAGTIGPRETVHVRVDPPARAGPGAGLLAELDASLYLPLRLTFFGPNSAASIDVELSFLSTREAPKDLFSLRVWWQERQTRVTYEPLACAVRFPVYALGESYGDLRYDLGGTLEQKRYRGQKIRVATELFLPYGRERHAGDPELNMSQEAANTPDARPRLRVYQRYGKAMRIRVAGATRTLYVIGRDGPRRAFGVVIGRTFVRAVTTLTVEQITGAVRQLRRMARRTCDDRAPRRQRRGGTFWRGHVPAAVKDHRLTHVMQRTHSLAQGRGLPR